MSKPIADPRTGEVLDEQVRPFAEMLTILDQGKAHAEASRALRDLVAAVADIGKPGSLTLSVKVAPVKGSDQLIVAMQVKTSPPKTDPAAAIFFRDRSGNLTREDPRQLTLDGLRVVEPKPARVVGED